MIYWHGSARPERHVACQPPNAGAIRPHRFREETIMAPLLAILEGGLSLSHWIIVLVVGILIFGKRLPEIGRTLGKGIVEFKKGLKGLEDDDPESGAAPVRPPR